MPADLPPQPPSAYVEIEKSPSDMGQRIQQVRLAFANARADSESSKTPAPNGDKVAQSFTNFLDFHQFNDFVNRN